MCSSSDVPLFLFSPSKSNIMVAVNNYLQNHMFTLALLPNNWKGSDGMSFCFLVFTQSQLVHPLLLLLDKKKGDRTSKAIGDPSSPQTSSSSLNQNQSGAKGKQVERSTSKKTLTDPEKRKAQESIEVLFEQKAQLDTFIAKFKREGQTEEVETLTSSKKELEAEIKRLQSLLSY